VHDVIKNTKQALLKVYCSIVMEDDDGIDVFNSWLTSFINKEH